MKKGFVWGICHDQLMDFRGVTIGAMKGECLEETKHGFVSGRVVFGNFCHSTACFVKRMQVKRARFEASVLRTS